MSAFKWGYIIGGAIGVFVAALIHVIVSLL